MHATLTDFYRYTRIHLNIRKTVYIAGRGPAVVISREFIFCTKKRFDPLREEFGEAFEGIEIAAKHARKCTGRPPHSVLTTHFIDDAGQPTREALERTLAFLKVQLMP